MYEKLISKYFPFYYSHNSKAQLISYRLIKSRDFQGPESPHHRDTQDLHKVGGSRVLLLRVDFLDGYGYPSTWLFSRIDT